jgi:CRISPR system Cascade subunit CasB
MTLYALHQQSHDNDEMHVPGIRFGAAVRRLAAEDGTKGAAGGGTKSGVADGEKSAQSKEDEAKGGKEDSRKQAITRRFMAVATAQSINEVLFHVRGLITQLRREKQPLDYAMFAEDVFNLLTPGQENRVRLAWGREFYRTPSAARSDKDGKTPEDSSTSDDDNE